MRRFWGGLTAGWALVVALLTLLPADRLPPVPPWRLISFDTAAHAGVFLTLALPLRQWWRVSGARHSFLGSAMTATLYGGLIEWLQTCLHWGRHGEWSDLLSDGLGALAGAGLASWLPTKASRVR